MPQPDPEFERLVSATELRRLCGNVCRMTLHRWLNPESEEKKPLLPPPVYINGRRYWPARVIRELQERGKVAA